MTATTAVHGFDWRDFDQNGSSVFLSNHSRQAVPLHTQGRAKSYLPNLFVFSGVSASAIAIQKKVNELMLELNQLQVSRHHSQIDVEREVVILLPPKSRRAVTVHVRHTGRAIPLLYSDDLLMESNSD